MRPKNWEELPVLLTVNDLRQLGLSRDQAYQILARLGLKCGRKFLVSKEAVRAVFERQAG